MSSPTIETRRLRAPKVLRRTLSSGLRLLAVKLPHAGRVVLEAHLRIGSRFETAKDNGISHFLEHMVFRGIPSHPTAHEQALAFETLGGTLNASTAADAGNLAIAVPPENIDRVLPLFSEVYTRPEFSCIDIERGIVREEILESLDDEGRDVDPDNLIRALVFEDHPLGSSITGSVKDLDGFTRARLRRMHQKHYCGAGTVLSMVGPIEPERALDALSKTFESLHPGAAAAILPPPPQRAPRFRFVRHNDSQTALRVGFRAPSFADRDEPAMDLLMRVLDDGMAARLYSVICDEQGLCYDVSASHEAYEDSGLVELCAECTHEHAYRVLESVLKIVSELRATGPSEEELSRAQRRHGWQLRDALDAPDELSGFLGHGELMGHPQTLGERQAQLDGVTRERAVEVAQRWFAPEQLSVVAVGLQPKRTQRALQNLVEAFH